MDPPKELVQTVARLFHTPKQIVALDLLRYHRVMNDEQLGKAMLISTREASKLLAWLKEFGGYLGSVPFAVPRKTEPSASSPLTPSNDNHLTETDSKVILGKSVDKKPFAEDKMASGVKGAFRQPFQKHFYYIDYPAAVNAIRLRWVTILEGLETKIREGSTQGTFKCPQCDRTYTALTASPNPFLGYFECPTCAIELIESLTTNSGSKASDAHALYEKFVTETKPIKDLLAKCDRFIFDEFDVKEAIMNSLVSSIIASSPSNSGPEESEPGDVDVDIEATSSAEPPSKKMREIPEWYSHSTVTGQQYLRPFADVKISVPVAKEAEKAVEEEEIVAMVSPKIKIDRVSIEAEQEEKSDNVPKEQTMVSVRGVLKLLSQITEEDQETMTPEEYTAYYDAINAADQ